MFDSSRLDISPSERNSYIYLKIVGLVKIVRVSDKVDKSSDRPKEIFQKGYTCIFKEYGHVLGEMVQSS